MATSLRTSELSPSVTSGSIIELEGDDATASGNDRRRALTLAFALCLAIGSAAVGRDGPAATAPIEPARTLTLTLPQDANDVVLFTFPDRLANEPLINLSYIPVRVRETQGLAVNLAEVVPSNTVWIGEDDAWGPFQNWMVTWTEGGTAYWLSSDRRGLSELLRVAGSLR